MRRLRIGIIGTGLIVRGAHLPALERLSDQYEIVAVCSGHRTNAEALANQIGDSVAVADTAGELLARDDVEAVDIATPIALNRPLAEEAAVAGKHIFLEKPIAANVKDGEIVAELGRRHGVVLLVAETHRYVRGYIMARAILDSGEIGEPRVLHWDDMSLMDEGNEYSRTLWRQKPEHVGGYLSDGGVHAASSITMVGGPIASLHALTASFNPQLLGDVDTMLVNIRFTSGLVGSLSYSVGAFETRESPLTVYGSDGRIAIEPEQITITKAGGERVVAVPKHDPFEDEFRDFYDAVVNDKQLSVQPEELLDDLRFVEAALISAQEDRPISLAM